MTNKKTIYSLSFFLPIVIVLFCWFLMKVPPFGDRVFLIGDDEIEYMNFFSYFKTFFTSNNSFFYSVARCCGAQMFNMMAYYNFCSPVNSLLFFCPEQYWNIGFQFLIAIKLGLCGLTFSYFLNKECNTNEISSVLFAVAYALAGDTILTSMANFIFIDSFILLPLVLLGVTRIIRENDYRLFVVSIALSILSNGYSGYVSLLFAFCWFIYKYSLECNYDWKTFFDKSKTLVISTFVGCCFTAWLLLPVQLGMPDEKYSFFHFSSIFNIRCNFIGLLSKFFSNNVLDNLFYDDVSPFVFIGIFTFILLLLYFFNNAIPKKERCISGIFLGFLVASFTLNFLFVLWSMGVEQPNGTIFRFTFVFKLFAIYLAYKSFLKIREMNIKYAFWCLSFFFLISCLVFLSKFYYVSTKYLAVDIVLAMVFFHFVFSCIKGKFKNICLMNFIVVALFFGNMTENTLYFYYSQNHSGLSTNASDFKNYVVDARKILDFLKKTDNDFYRTDSETWFANYKACFYNNSPLLLNFNGISHYSSFFPSYYLKFFDKIGVLRLFDDGGVTVRKQQIAFPSMLLGIKYMMSTITDTKYPFEIVKNQKDLENNKLYLFKNSLALPVAFVVENNPDLLSDFSNKFGCDFQNDVLKTLAGKDFGDVYSAEHLGILNKNFVYKVKSDDNLYILTENNHKIENIFAYIKINGKSYFDNYLPLAYYQYNYLGNFSKNSRLNFDFDFQKNQDGDSLQNYDIDFSVVYENMPKLKKYYDEISKKPCKIEKISSSHLKIYLDEIKDNQYLFLTIPFDKAWKVKVDGEVRPPAMVFGALTVVPLKLGDKIVEMNYVPIGFKLGFVISLLAFLAILYGFFNYKSINGKV